MGSLSGGRLTAAKIRGRVTKLPEGMPPAPTLAIRVVMTTMICEVSGKVAPKGLGEEEGGRGLVERSSVVVEVGAHAGGELGIAARDAELSGEGVEREGDGGGGAGRAEGGGHDVAGGLQEPGWPHSCQAAQLQQVPDDLAGQAQEHDQDEPAQVQEQLEALSRDAHGHDAEDGQGDQGDDPEQHLHQEFEADGDEVDDRLVADLATGSLLVADVGQADRQGQGDQHELGQVVRDKRLANRARDHLAQDVERGLRGRRGHHLVGQRGQDVDEPVLTAGGDRAQVSPFAGCEQVREHQADDHRHQGVDQVEAHHPQALAAVDVVGDDRAQDGQHDQRRGQGPRRRMTSLGTRSKVTARPDRILTTKPGRRSAQEASTPSKRPVGMASATAISTHT